MSNFIKLNSRTIIFGTAALALLAVASPAMAQDYSVNIKRTADVLVETEYASIKKQIKKYCGDEARRTGFAHPLSARMHYERDCQALLMKNFLTQSGDRALMAYHTDLRTGTVRMAKTEDTQKIGS